MVRFPVLASRSEERFLGLDKRVSSLN